MCAFSRPEWLLDGLNAAGLSAHLLSMPGGDCTYRPYGGDGSDLSEVDLIGYLLGTCATVVEVRTALAGISIWGMDPGLGFALEAPCARPLRRDGGPHGYGGPRRLRRGDCAFG
jgi:choloylglycine hydrolase